MFKVITAPTVDLSIDHFLNFKVFLAGGISNCPDWQQNFINYFIIPNQDIESSKPLIEINNFNLSLLNPRRPKFPIHIPEESERQIVWEHTMLDSADLIIFWFSKGSDNPIVFYELGKYIRSKTPILIGLDPEFKRHSDVIYQSILATGKRPGFFYSINDLATEVCKKFPVTPNNNYVEK